MAITILDQNDKIELQNEINQRVKTINGAIPDENGNVEVDIPEGGSGASDEQIAQAVADYLMENPAQAGATPEQAAQIEANKQAIEALQNGSNSGGNVDLTGKATEILPNIVLFGDSITDVKAEGLWVGEVGKYAKFESLNNYARGFCTFTFKEDTEFNDTDSSNANVGNNVIWNQFNRLKKDVANGQVAPDVIVILAGANDALRGIALGNVDTAFTGDILSANVNTLTTLAQSVRYVCEEIKLEYPDSQVILCTPLQMGVSNNNVFAVRDMIVKCANRLSVKVIDQTYEAGVYGYHEATGNIFQNDNVHLNERGAVKVAQFLAREFYNKINIRATMGGNGGSVDRPEVVTLESITATFNSGSATIYTTDSISSLREYLVVTGNYSDGTIAPISTYELSGELNTGSNTITVTYQGLNTTFIVIAEEKVIEPTLTIESVSAQFNQNGAVIYETDTLAALRDYLTVTAHYNNGSSQVINDYTLSGELNVGTSSITVNYIGYTTSFNVLVSEAITYVDTRSIEGSEIGLVAFDALPIIILYNRDYVNDTTILSGKTLDNIIMRFNTTGELTFGRVDLTLDKAVLIDPFTVTINGTGEQEIDLNNMVLGKNETLGIGAKTDTASFYFMANYSGLEAGICAEDAFNKSYPDLGFKCRINFVT